MEKPKTKEIRDKISQQLREAKIKETDNQEGLICEICTVEYNSETNYPVTHNCGHTFCYKCVTLSKSKRCFLCKASYGETAKKNIQMMKMITALKELKSKHEAEDYQDKPFSSMICPLGHIPIFQLNPEKCGSCSSVKHVIGCEKCQFFNCYECSKLDISSEVCIYEHKLKTVNENYCTNCGEKKYCLKKCSECLYYCICEDCKQGEKPILCAKSSVMKKKKHSICDNCYTTAKCYRCDCCLESFCSISCLESFLKYRPSDHERLTSNERNNKRKLNKIVKKNGTYFGYVLNGKFNGAGVFNYHNDQNYVGEWVNDIKHGIGRFKWQNEDYFEGQWVNDNREGYGFNECSNGDVYLGEYAEGNKNGVGVYFWNNGDIYEGQWKDNLKHGLGKVEMSSGDSYEGQYENDEKSGTGVFKWRNGNKYYGQWRNNKKHGFGYFISETGNFFYGQWREGVKHGKGEVLLVNGEPRVEFWENGRVVKK